MLTPHQSLLRRFFCYIKEVGYSHFLTWLCTVYSQRCVDLNAVLRTRLQFVLLVCHVTAVTTRAGQGLGDLRVVQLRVGDHAHEEGPLVGEVLLALAFHQVEHFVGHLLQQKERNSK